MLRLVTDSHVPPAVAKAARRLAAVDITALRDWHGGLYLHESDERLLALAWEAHITLITYDVNTFPIWNATPLIALDVYEHAYFLDYRTDRASYIDAFFNNLDWATVNDWVSKYQVPLK